MRINSNPVSRKEHKKRKETEPCHPERREGSRMINANGRADGFFASLRMTRWARVYL
jgi:hypothetical protein